MQLIVLGLSHKTAPLQLRERFAIPDERLVSIAEKVRQAGFRESFVVSTCNRVEFYAAADDIATPDEQLAAVMAEVGRAGLGELNPHVYHYAGLNAIVHLFRVAASLDSMVVGEPQILGQLKSAFDRCRQAGVTGPALNRAAERAFSTAKRVRTETGIGRHVISISSVAVQLAKQIFGDLNGRSAALLGAGKMGELAAEHLVSAGVSQLYVANRSQPRAHDLANKLGGHARDLAELPNLLSQVDILLTSTGARHHLINMSMMRSALKARKYRPIFLIDIAVPRNVSPAINDLDNVYLYDVDDLHGIADANRQARAQEADSAEAMVVESAHRLLDELAVQALKPTIVAVRERFETLKRDEVERVARRLGADETTRRALESVADGLSAKLLHGVLMSLKRSPSHPDGAETVRLIRDIYLSQETEEK